VYTLNPFDDINDQVAFMLFSFPNETTPPLQLSNFADPEIVIMFEVNWIDERAASNVLTNIPE